LTTYRPIAASALFLLIGVAHADPPPQPSTSITPPASIDSPADRVARALAYTVTIDGSGIYGSGVLVAPALVLTSSHVVEGMADPRVTFFDGAIVDAKLVELDRTLDLALLSIPQQRRAAPVWGDASSLRPGEELYAIGNPRHLGFTVSRGIVSFVDRPFDGVRYLQTDLPINEGNSGGPVLNARGELVALSSFILKRAQGLSFALPVRYASERFARALGTALGDPLQRQRRELPPGYAQSPPGAVRLPARGGPAKDSPKHDR
jgi:S1-C subfamily serine protease